LPTVEELYGELWAGDEAFRAEVERSLNPRPAESLYAMFGKLGVNVGDLVLDVGCRDAKHSVELVRRFDCRVIAADLIPRHLEKLEDGSVDYVWCRDMLNHVQLPAALSECFRVLRPRGGMLVYQTFATDLCEPGEARRLWSAMAIVPENMSRPHFEQTADTTGFEIAAVDEIDSEWRESWLEAGDRHTVDLLLRAARLRRREAELVARYGRDRYEAALGGAVWGVYQLLGKLCPTVYVLEKARG
jgi:SAM-dependent methyltransferase